MAIDINSDYSVTLIDEVVLADSTSNTITITLPAVHPAGKRYYVKDKFGTTDTNQIVILATPNQIDNGASFGLTVERQSIMIHSDGTNWWVL